MKDDAFDFDRLFGSFGRRTLPDNEHGRRALAHRRAGERWPIGSAPRQMHEAAEASDMRLAFAEAGR
jgi:hypothetical protein